MTFFSIVGEQAPTAGFAKSFQSTLGLSTSTVNSLASKSSSCGYDSHNSHNHSVVNLMSISVMMR